MPDVGVSMPMMILSRVDLPDPLGPVKPYRQPSLKEAVTFSKRVRPPTRFGNISQCNHGNRNYFNRSHVHDKRDLWNFTLAVERFLTHLKLSKGVSAHTLRGYSIDLQGFKSFSQEQESFAAGGDRPNGSSGAISPICMNRNASIRTTLRRLSALRSFFKFAIREKLVAENPLEEIESPKREKKLPVSIDYNQVQHLLNQPDLASYLGLRDRAIMELMYSSGLRLSEIVGLNKRDLDVKSQQLSIFGKGKKQRMTPITQTALDWILKYLNHPERMLDCKEHRAEADPAPIFLNRWGKRLSARSVDRNFASYLKVERPIRAHHAPYDPPYDRDPLAGTWNGSQNNPNPARPHLSGDHNHLHACLIQTETRGL